MATQPDRAGVDPGEMTATDLGPFRPPAGYRFEEELQGPPPRPRADVLREGRYAVKRRRTAWGLLVAGAILALLGTTTAVQTMGLYFLPLAYLTWIGLTLAALGGAAFVANLFGRGPYRYVEEGVPTVARIRALRLVPAAFHNGQPTQYKFEALFDYLDPETNEPSTALGASGGFMADARHKLTTSYRVGDYATAVYLPHDPAGTIRLYGFLDLRPDLGLTRRDGEPPTSPLKLGLMILAILGLFSALFWNLYAFGRFSPLAIPTASAAAVGTIGAVVLGGGMLAYIAGEQARARRKRDARNAEAIARGEPVEADAGRRRGPFGDFGPIMTAVLVAGALLLGGLTFYCWAISANALLDGSPATTRPVVIDRMVQVTHKAIFREYQIKYHFFDDPATRREWMSTPGGMAGFEAPLGLADVRGGRFGWPWVKDIRPLLPRPAGP